MASPGKILTSQIIREFGALPDLRLWRNETGTFWAGRPLGRTDHGHLILSNASRVSAGLVVGSSDIIGVRGIDVGRERPVGVFVALEVKAGRDRLTEEQRTFIRVVRNIGGIAAEVRSAEDVAGVLGL